MKNDIQNEILSALLDAQREQNAFLTEQLKQQSQTNQQLQQLIEKLQLQIEELLRKLYGKKSEKIPAASTDKPADSLPGKDDKETKQPSTGQKSSKANGQKRRTLPEALPRQRIEYTLSHQELACPDCGTTRAKIGECQQEQLDFIPAQLIVKEHVRFKYACKPCKGQVVCAAMPNQPIDKGLVGPGLLSEVIISKYQDALPLYRQEQRFKRLGFELSRKTLCDWVQSGAFWLKAIVDEMKKDFLLYQTIHSDDTVYPILSKDKTHKGRLWVYLARQTHKPWICLYEYTKTREQIHPQRFLKEYQGYLHADAYAGYDKLYNSGHIIEVACMAHARRKFFEIAEKIKAHSIAHEAMTYIGKLYDIETISKEMSIVQRYCYRRKHAKPLLKKYYRFLKRTLPKTLPKSPIHNALSYSLTHWKALCNYLRHGDLHIDNNAAERAIKPFVIGRKNFLFSASHEGAENAATLYSIIETCKLNGINTFNYLRDVFCRLPNIKSNQVRELLPYYWKPSAP